MSNSVFREHYNDDSSSEKLSQKAKDSPFMVFGLAGLVAVCGIGVFKYRNRGTMSTSVFLMQLRVAAQGTVVGALSIGLVYSMIQKYVLHSDQHNLTPVKKLPPPTEKK